MRERGWCAYYDKNHDTGRFTNEIENLKSVFAHGFEAEERVGAHRKSTFRLGTDGSTPKGSTCSVDHGRALIAEANWPNQHRV